MLHHRGPDEHWHPPRDKYIQRLTELHERHILGDRRLHVAAAPFDLGPGQWVEMTRNLSLRENTPSRIVSMRSDTLKIFNDMSFDSIVFLESIDKSAFPTALLDDAARLIVPGGHLVFGFETDLHCIHKEHACRLGVHSVDILTQMLRRVTDRFSLYEHSPANGFVVYIAN